MTEQYLICFTADVFIRDDRRRQVEGSGRLVADPAADRRRPGAEGLRQTSEM